MADLQIDQVTKTFGDTQVLKGISLDIADGEFEDLMDQTIMLPEQGSLTQQVVHQKLAECQMELPQLITMTTFPVMCEAVRQGLGAAIFLKNSSHIYDGLVEIPIRDFHQIHQTCFVAPKDRARLKLINEFRAAALAITFQ